MGREDRAEAAVCSEGHRRLVFRLLPSGLAWEASPPGRQHGVAASAQATRVRQGERGLPGGPWVVRGVRPEPWVSTQCLRMRLPARRRTRVLFSCCDPSARLLPNLTSKFERDREPSAARAGLRTAQHSGNRVCERPMRGLAAPFCRDRVQ